MPDGLSERRADAVTITMGALQGECLIPGFRDDAYRRVVAERIVDAIIRAVGAEDRDLTPRGRNEVSE